MKSLTAQDFQKEVIEASHQVPVLVDFWAEWCAPCRILSPVLEKLEREYQGKWKLAKVNTDYEPELAMKFRVTGIPHCVLFKNGKAVDSFTGALPEPLIRKFLDKHIPNEERDYFVKELQSNVPEKIKNAVSKIIEKKIDGTEVSFHLWKSMSIYIAEKDIDMVKKILNYLIERKAEYASSATSLLDYIKKHEDQEYFWEYLNKFIHLFGNENQQRETLEFFYQLIEQNLSRKMELKDHLVTCFNILGQNHPLSNEYRKKLSRLLF
ncbi:MAG: thioredoxin [Leptospiraceae bacterium]|nr:thioredoxin [Leptospiraceae bacterium]MDW7976121.1 thioredoxin [Leptospiraceae bacterium]